MKRKKHLFFLILLALVCLVLLGTGTLAAYTKVENVKRVAAVKSSTDELCFSSNYLTLWDGGDRTKKTFNVNQNSSFTIHLNICNYPQKDITKFSASDIVYTLSISLINENGDVVNNPAVNDLLSVNPTYAGEHRLSGGAANYDRYIISSNNIETLARYTIRIEATSSSLNKTLDKTLAADLKLKITSQSISWKVEPADTGSDFDAFNFDIFGTAEETVTLSWPSSVIISHWAEDELPNAHVDGNSITFTVGGAEQPTRYRIQFYKVDKNVTLEQITNDIKIEPSS